jgi:hypothetical protein
VPGSAGAVVSGTCGRRRPDRHGATGLDTRAAPPANSPSTSIIYRFAGHRNESVATPSVLKAGTTTFRHGVGDLRVDLRRTRATPGAVVRASVDVGRVVVQLPRGSRLRAAADSGLGQAEVRR